MLFRTCAAIAILAQLSACIATPNPDIVDRINFNAPAPDETPMSYADLLCCYDCQA